jgi:hypothetical protein
MIVFEIISIAAFVLSATSFGLLFWHLSGKAVVLPTTSEVPTKSDDLVPSRSRASHSILPSYWDPIRRKVIHARLKHK